MGILNITPDSFYSNSRTNSSEIIIKRSEEMVAAGADILDIGGYSSRPGAASVSEEEEIKRVMMALEIVRKRVPETIISVDTFRSSVARMAVENYDIDIINDISGGVADSKMIEYITGIDKPYIIMHMQGTPENMQDNPFYKDIVSDLLKWFSEKIDLLRKYGVSDLIVDPGFGFGKSVDHNYSLLRNLDRFSILECPILVGLSRKSMIRDIIGGDAEAGSSLVGTTALNAAALMKGATILRVHDVAEAVITIDLLQRVKGRD
jgi:dihydropteroate synthase